MTVTITKVLPEQEHIIQNMVQLYTHDFSEFWAGTPRGDLSADGRFEDYPLEEYRTNPGSVALLIWCDGTLAGFSLLNDKSHSGEPAGHNMAEFFILRKYRGLGVSTTAAQTIFSQFPGSWELAVTRKNLRAQAFWRKAVQDKAKDIYEIDMNNEIWNGPVIRFNWND